MLLSSLFADHLTLNKMHLWERVGHGLHQEEGGGEREHIYTETYLLHYVPVHVWHMSKGV